MALVSDRLFAPTRRDIGRFMTAGAAGLLLPHAIVRSARADAQAGGQLTVTLFQDLRTLNPIMGIFGNEWRATINLYDNLTRILPTGAVEPALAVSYEAGEDARVWTFKLRTGVKFHDGSVFGSGDVVATIEKILDPKTAAPYKAEIGPIASVKAIDGMTVRFELSTPYADFPKAMASPTARMVSQQGVADFAKLDATEHGTGPFMLKEFVPNEHVIMERNPNYYRPGLPYLDRVVMRVLPDPNTQVAALRNREVDVIADVDTDTFKEVAGIAGVNAMQVPGGTFNNIVLYANKPPFDDPKVRMALRLAMDRQAMAEAVASGTGAPADDEPISASYEYFDKTMPIRKQDLAQARQLLKQMGHGDGFEHKLVVSNSPATRQKTAVVVQAMARQIGIQFNIELMDNARYGSTIWNKGIESYVGNYTTRPTEDAILSKLYSAKYGIDEGRWTTPEFEAMLDAGRTTTDPEKRRKIYVDFQRMAADQGPFIIPNFFNSLAGAWGYVNSWPIRAMVADMKLDETWLGADAPGRKKT